MEIRRSIFTLGLIVSFLGTQSMQAWTFRSPAPKEVKKAVKKIKRNVSSSLLESPLAIGAASLLVGLALGGFAAYRWTQRDGYIKINTSQVDESKDGPFFGNHPKLNSTNSLVIPVQDPTDLDSYDIIPDQNDALPNENQNISLTSNTPEPESTDPIELFSDGLQASHGEEVVPFSSQTLSAPTTPRWQAKEYEIRFGTKSKKLKVEYKKDNNNVSIKGSVVEKLYNTLREQLNLAEHEYPTPKGLFQFDIDKNNFFNTYVALRMMLRPKHVSNFMIDNQLNLALTENALLGYREKMGTLDNIRPAFEALFKNPIHPDGTPMMVLKNENSNPTTYVDALNVVPGQPSPSKAIALQPTGE